MYMVSIQGCGFGLPFNTLGPVKKAWREQDKCCLTGNLDWVHDKQQEVTKVYIKLLFQKKKSNIQQGRVGVSSAKGVS